MGRQAHGKTGRQTQTDRQADRQAGRQAARKTDRQTEIQTEICTERQCKSKFDDFRIVCDKTIGSNSFANETDGTKGNAHSCIQVGVYNTLPWLLSPKLLPRWDSVEYCTVFTGRCISSYCYPASSYLQGRTLRSVCSV
jgi:hypothetical protein